MKKQKQLPNPVANTERKPPEIRPPVDIVDGIPDRAARRPLWKYIVLLVIFLAWVAFLIYCLVMGNI